MADEKHINSNPLDLPHLVRVCEAATPGPWEDGACSDGHNAPINNCVLGFRENVETIIAQSDGDSPQDSMDMEFISTFNPSTVLALLRRLEEAEDKVKNERADVWMKAAKHARTTVSGIDRGPEFSRLNDSIKLANRILDRPYADPDDNLAMLARQFLRSIEARDRLAGRLRELEQRLATYDDEHKKNRILSEEIIALSTKLRETEHALLERTEPTRIHTQQLIEESVRAATTALTQRLAMMEEGFNELVKSYHAMQQTAMKLFDRLDANGLIGADGTERHALLQEIAPVDAITSEDIAKAQQALEGK